MEHNDPLLIDDPPFGDDVFDEDFPEFEITDTEFVAERNGTMVTFKYDDDERITKMEINGKESPVEYNEFGTARFELDGREYTISKPKADSEDAGGYIIREAGPERNTWFIVQELPYYIRDMVSKTVADRDGEPITLHYCCGVSAFESANSDQMKSIFISYRDHVVNVSAKDELRPGTPSKPEYYKIGDLGIEKTTDAKNATIGVSIIPADKYQTKAPPKVEITRIEDGKLKDVTNYDMHMNRANLMFSNDVDAFQDAVEKEAPQDEASSDSELFAILNEDKFGANWQQNMDAEHFESLKELPEIRGLIDAVLEGRSENEKEAILNTLSERADGIVTADDFVEAFEDVIADTDKSELNKDVEVLKSLCDDKSSLTIEEKVRVEQLAKSAENIKAAISDHRKDDLKTATEDMLKQTGFGEVVKSFVAGKFEAHSEADREKLDITKEEKASGVVEKWFGEKGTIISRCDRGDEIFKINRIDGKQPDLAKYENSAIAKGSKDGVDSLRKEFGAVIGIADRMTNLVDAETAVDSFGIDSVAKEDGYDIEREQSAIPEERNTRSERNGSGFATGKEDTRPPFEEKVKAFKDVHKQYKAGAATKYEVINAGIDAIGHCRNPLLIKVAVEEMLADHSVADVSRDRTKLEISESERKDGVYYKTFGENGTVISLFDGGCRWEFAKKIDGAVSKTDYENGAREVSYEGGKRELTVNWDKILYKIESAPSGDLVVRSGNAEFRLREDITESDGEKYLTLSPRGPYDNPTNVRLAGAIKESADFKEEVFDFFSKTDGMGARTFVSRLADLEDARIEVPYRDTSATEEEKAESIRDAKDIASLLWDILPRDAATKIAENAKGLMEKGWSPEKAFESSFDKAIEEGWIRDDKSPESVEKYNTIYDKIEDYHNRSRAPRDTISTGMEIKKLILAKRAGVPISVGGVQRAVTTGDIVSAVLRFTQSNIFETLIWNAVVSIADAFEGRDTVDKNVEDTEKNRSERSPADVEEMKSDVEKSIDRQNADKPDNDDIDKRARDDEKDSESKSEKDTGDPLFRTGDRDTDRDDKEPGKETEKNGPDTDKPIEPETLAETDQTDKEDDSVEDAASPDFENEKKPSAADLEDMDDPTEMTEVYLPESREDAESAYEQDEADKFFAAGGNDDANDADRWSSGIEEEIGRRQDSPEYDYETMQSDMIDRALRDPSDEDRLEDLRNLLRETLPDEFNNESFDKTTEELSKEIANEPTIENNYNSVEQGEGEFGEKLYSDGDVFDSYTGTEVEPIEIDIEKEELDDRFSQQIEQTVEDVEADKDMVERDAQNDTEINGNDTEMIDDLNDSNGDAVIDDLNGSNGDAVIDDSINTEYAELPDMQGDDIRFDESVDMDAQPSDASSMDDCETGEDIAETIASIIA